MTTDRVGALASASPAETRRLGERLASALQPEDVVLLSGELGAGKTVFVEGIARGLGVAHSISSKSFVLLGEYAGRIKLYHADLYRLESPEQVDELGLDDYCRDGALVVEWPERDWGLFPDDVLVVRFLIVDEGSRELTLEARGPRGRELAQALTA